MTRRESGEEGTAGRKDTPSAPPPLLLPLFSLEEEAEEDKSLFSLTAFCLANTSFPAVIFEDKF